MSEQEHFCQMNDDTIVPKKFDKTKDTIYLRLMCATSVLDYMLYIVFVGSNIFLSSFFFLLFLVSFELTIFQRIGIDIIIYIRITYVGQSSQQNNMYAK